MSCQALQARAPGERGMAVVETAVASAPDRTGRGILLLLGGIFIFSIQDVIVRTVSGTYPVLEFVFIRSVFSIFPVLALVVIDGGLATLKVTRPGLHAVRGLLMLLCYTTYFIAVASAPLATVVAIFFSAPLILTALSALILHEPVGWRRWAAVLAGFGGVVLILRPGEGMVFEPGALVAVVSAGLYACAMIITRRLGATDSGVSMVASQTAIYLVLPGLAGLLMQGFDLPADTHPGIQFLLRDWIMPTSFDLGLMAACGLIAAAGFFGLTQAYRLGATSAVAPFEYTGMIWGIVWGFVFWQEVPGPLSLAGIAIIVGAGIYVLRREAVRGRRVVAGRPLRGRM